MKSSPWINLTIVSLLLVTVSGCATRQTAFTGPKLKIADADPRSKADAKFKKDGHQYTTFLVAMFADIDPAQADVLTHYSQVPDLDWRFNAVPTAIWASFVPWRWPWRSDIMQALHSLHGGNNAEVQYRRHYVGLLIRNRVQTGTSQSLMEAGLMIHALGDAHSHTTGTFGSGNEQGYGPLVGHGYLGGHPDEIARPEVFPKYAAHVRNLYAALGGGDAGRPRVEAYLQNLSTNCWKPGRESFSEANFRMATAIQTQSTNVGGFDQSRYDAFVKAQPKLISSAVQRVMDDINRGVPMR